MCGKQTESEQQAKLHARQQKAHSKITTKSLSIAHESGEAVRVNKPLIGYQNNLDL